VRSATALHSCFEPSLTTRCLACAFLTVASAEIATLLTQLGYSTVFSVVDGFEGDVAASGQKQGQRVVNGWKNADLPWSYKLDKDRMTMSKM
jgi:hypothetical protein